MASFEMVKYHAQVYPEDIPLRLEEVAAHFDVADVHATMRCSLHTEYSYGKRKLDSERLMRFSAVTSAQKDGVPQLWKSERWAEEFAGFIFDLMEGREPPCVIEIHPPFSDYTDMQGFVESYSRFENRIATVYPQTEILLENRCGSIYRGGRFVVSKVENMEELCRHIEESGLKLKIACDIPQIYTAHNVKKDDAYIRLLERIKELRAYIGGVHLWGKKRTPQGRKVAHCGDLNSYFEGNAALKEAFLSAFAECFGDGVVRKMVLEVNSGQEDMSSILEDLRGVGVSFI